MSYLWNFLSMKRIISELLCKWNVMSNNFFLGGGDARSPHSGAPRGGQTLNCKLKTFCFLDTLKVHVQSKTLASTTLSLLQTKLAEKNSKLIFMLLPLQFQIWKVTKLWVLQFTGLWGALPPSSPVYGLNYLMTYNQMS